MNHKLSIMKPLCFCVSHIHKLIIYLISQMGKKIQLEVVLPCFLPLGPSVAFSWRVQIPLLPRQVPQSHSPKHKHNQHTICQSQEKNLHCLQQHSLSFILWKLVYVDCIYYISWYDLRAIKKKFQILIFSIYIRYLVIFVFLGLFALLSFLLLFTILLPPLLSFFLRWSFITKTFI